MSAVKQKKMKKTLQNSFQQSVNPDNSIVLDRGILSKMARQIKEKMNAHSQSHSTGDSTSEATGLGLGLSSDVTTDCKQSPIKSSSAFKSFLVKPIMKSQDLPQPEIIPQQVNSILDTQPVEPSPVNSSLNITNQMVARMANCLREKLKANTFSDPFTSANCVDSTSITIPSPVPLVTKLCANIASVLPVLTYERVGKGSTYLKPRSLRTEESDGNSDDDTALKDSEMRENEVETLLEAPPTSVGLPMACISRSKGGTRSRGRPARGRLTGKQKSASSSKAVSCVKKSASSAAVKGSRVRKITRKNKTIKNMRASK